MKMTNDQRGHIICRLLPNAKYRGCWYDDSIIWLDDRPIPDEIDIKLEFENIKDELDMTQWEHQYQDILMAALLQGHMLEFEDYNKNKRKARFLFDVNDFYVYDLILSHHPIDEPIQVKTVDGIIPISYNTFEVLVSKLKVARYKLYNSIVENKLSDKLTTK